MGHWLQTEKLEGERYNRVHTNQIKLATNEGIEARLAAADKDAAKIAQEDVEALIDIQGDINNFKLKSKSVVEITSNEDIDT